MRKYKNATADQKRIVYPRRYWGQQTASTMRTALERGEEGVDLTQVMVAMQKSSLSFQAMVEVRNKLVEAYKDVMNMPV